MCMWECAIRGLDLSGSRPFNCYNTGDSGVVELHQAISLTTPISCSLRVVSLLELALRSSWLPRAPELERGRGSELTRGRSGVLEEDRAREAEELSRV